MSITPWSENAATVGSLHLNCEGAPVTWYIVNPLDGDSMKSHISRFVINSTILELGHSFI